MWQAEADTELTLSASPTTAVGQKALALAKRRYSTVLSRAHIFPKAQVAANKNAHNFQHHFLAQFFMLFHMVWSILFGVLALKTLEWEFLIGCWRISTNKKVVSQANTTNKMDHTKWKIMKNRAQKWCRKLCAFLFEVTYDFGKMWGHYFLSFLTSTPPFWSC